MMEALFQNEKSEKEIALLNKENQLKKAELNRQKIQNYTILTGLGFTIVVVILMLRTFMQRRNAHQLLKVQKKEIEQK